MSLTADACARDVLDAVPTVMRFIRTEMRGHRTAGLSVPQFRALLFIHRNEGAPLMSVSDHLGLTPASTSTLVDGLSRRSLVQRRASARDRRKVTLALTASGRKAMEATLLETQRSLCGALQALQPAEMRSIADAMACLKRVFAPSGEPVARG